MQGDGLIVVTPRSAIRRRVSPRLIVIVALAILAFKSFMLSWMGTDAYQARVDALGTGTPIEKGGAFIMQIDPATAAIANHVGPLLR